MIINHTLEYTRQARLMKKLFAKRKPYCSGVIKWDCDDCFISARINGPCRIEEKRRVIEEYLKEEVLEKFEELLNEDNC